MSLVAYGYPDQHVHGVSSNWVALASADRRWAYLFTDGLPHVCGQR